MDQRPRTIQNWSWTSALVAIMVLFTPPLAWSADDLVAKGRDRYVNDCAACHGDDLRGGGPVREVLTIPPSDLTQLSRDNRGEFPQDYVRRVVDGRELPPAAHGETRMPIWGNHYRRSLPAYSEQIVQRNIDELIAYLRSVQAE
ncbi:MAG: c-type cytochrome [Gammaproteobacteria bacterium]